MSTIHDVEQFNILYHEYQSNMRYLKLQYTSRLQHLTQELSHTEIYTLLLNIIETNIAFASTCTSQLKLQYYNDACVVCHYALHYVTSSNTHLIYKYLNLIQHDLFNACTTTIPKLITTQFDIDELSHKSILQALRLKIKTHISLQHMSILYKEIMNDMILYLSTLFEAAQRIMGPSPCEYTVLGLGSLASGQITPYSDYEFALLVQYDTDIQYFRNLTHIVQFMIINLGETVIPISYYDVNWDKIFVQHSKAVSFDLGGKTPLGRIDKRYTLIQTMHGMLQYLKDEKLENIDKFMPYLIQRWCFVYNNYGTQEQFNTFYTYAYEILLAPTHRIQHTIRYLHVDADEIHCITGNSAHSLGDLYKYRFEPYTIKNVKLDIYRPTDIFIFSLGLISGIYGENNWDTIHRLEKMAIINEIAASNLRFVLNFATFLRLTIYNQHEQQYDIIDCDITNYDIMLARYCNIMNALQCALKNFCSIYDKLNGCYDTCFICENFES